MAKYRVTDHDGQLWVAEYGQYKFVTAWKKRRFWFDKRIGSRQVSAQHDREAEKRDAEKVNGWGSRWIPVSRYKPITDEQIRDAALKVIAEYEFPRPQIELCRHECKQL